MEEERAERENEEVREREEDFGDNLLGRVRTWTWNLLEYPETSKVEVKHMASLILQKNETYIIIIIVIALIIEVIKC